MKSSDFVCDGTSDPSVCAGLPFYKNWQSHQLCVLHFPGKKSLKLFQDCADAKLDRDDFNFDGVWFPAELSLDFEDREFVSDVVFSNCTFNSEVSFRRCVFHKKAKFSDGKFNDDLNFEFCKFLEDADFSRSSFEGYTDFSGSDFKSSVTFADCTFVGEVIMAVGFEHRTNFRAAVLKVTLSFRIASFVEKLTFGEQNFSLLRILLK